MKTVLLVEDDAVQAKVIKYAIEENYPGFLVIVLRTEYDFEVHVDWMPEGAAFPLMVICDVMLPWALPEVNASVPPEVEQGTFRKAGTRCWKWFRRHEQFRTVPWVYFTVLDEATMEFANHSDEFTGYAQKGPSIEPLFVEMARLFQNSPGMQRRLAEGLNTPLGECVIELPSVEVVE